MQNLSSLLPCLITSSHKNKNKTRLSSFFLSLSKENINMARRVSFMQRGNSVKARMSGRHSMWGRDMFGLIELGEDQFDSSLGCPLSTYEEATLNLIGGKALQCWRLVKFGLPVPNSFVIPTFVYSMHIEKAGVVDLIDEVFGSDLRDENVREAAKPKLVEIRTKIMETPLMDAVVENLEAWMDMAAGGTAFAVRSSGSAEGKILSHFTLCLEICQCSHRLLFLNCRLGWTIVCWAVRYFLVQVQNGGTRRIYQRMLGKHVQGPHPRVRLQICLSR
jgi:hypothetical protein